MPRWFFFSQTRTHVTSWAWATHPYATGWPARFAGRRPDAGAGRGARDDAAPARHHGGRRRRGQGAHHRARAWISMGGLQMGCGGLYVPFHRAPCSRGGALTCETVSPFPPPSRARPWTSSQPSGRPQSWACCHTARRARASSRCASGTGSHWKRGPQQTHTAQAGFGWFRSHFRSAPCMHTRTATHAGRASWCLFVRRPPAPPPRLRRPCCSSWTTTSSCCSRWASARTSGRSRSAWPSGTRSCGW